MIKVALVRGKYLNNFEGQNYVFPSSSLIKLTAISSLFPINSTFPFPTIKLASMSDFGNNRLFKFLTNRILGDSQILFGLEKLADKFDIFHTADPHYYYSYQLAKLRSRNLIKKLILTSWETIPANNESISRKKLIKRFTLKQVDEFICHTNRAKRALIKEGVDERKIEMVRLGVDINRFKFQFPNSNFPIRQAQGPEFIEGQTISKFQFPKINILFVGRLVKEKGVEDLQRAMAAIKNSRIKLKIVSSVAYEQMPRVYQNADILVLPSKTTKTWEEQYGMVLVEAMACGLPIVAYDSGAIAEVIGGVGILVKEDDVDGLRRAILELINDSNLRAKLGKMGRERVICEFDSLKTAKKLAKIYENINRYSY